MLVRLEAAAGDEDAEVGARVAIATGACDAEVERLALVTDVVPVGVPTYELDRSVARHLPDSGRRRIGDLLRTVVDVFQHELTPGVDVLLLGPAGVEILDIDLVADVQINVVDQRWIGCKRIRHAVGFR